MADDEEMGGGGRMEGVGEREYTKEEATPSRRTGAIRARSPPWLRFAQMTEKKAECDAATAELNELNAKLIERKKLYTQHQETVGAGAFTPCMRISLSTGRGCCRRKLLRVCLADCRASEGAQV
jgi:hypothetical protein